MQTWKDVFRRKEERQNLKNIGVCFLLIVTLVAGSFALTGLRDMFQASRDEPSEWEITATIETIDGR